jgi:thioredoxin 1
MEQVAAQWGDRVNFYAMDLNRSPNAASEFAIMGLPTLIFFKGGREAGRMMSVPKQEKIVEKVKSLLGTA